MKYEKPEIDQTVDLEGQLSPHHGKGSRGSGSDWQPT